MLLYDVIFQHIDIGDLKCLKMWAGMANGKIREGEGDQRGKGRKHEEGGQSKYRWVDKKRMGEVVVWRWGGRGGAE